MPDLFLPLSFAFLAIVFHLVIDRDLKADRALVKARKEKRDRVCGCK